MRILMIAPEPFFEPRGTPFSEYHRIRALLHLGHSVDLVTYPFGADVSLPGLRIFRSLRPPGLRGIGIGPSWAKVPLDALLALTAARRAVGASYDAVHSHEEGGVIGVLLAAVLGLPHLYDMHSSLPQQLTNFNFTRSRVLTGLFRWIERFVIRRSRVVIVICPQLEDTVRAIDPDVPRVLIENALAEAPRPGSGLAIRRTLGFDPTVPLVLYTGTFEPYQGLDLLFAAMATVRADRPDARLVLAGGRPDQIEDAKREVAKLGLAEMVLFAGQRPADEIPAFLDAADVLVSPRSLGTNTPLKIYQYLRAVKPIVATRLPTHTQVLDDTVAFLSAADPDAFGSAILDALNDPVRARLTAERAEQLASTKYSEAAYFERTRQACDLLFGPPSAQVAGEVA